MTDTDEPENQRLIGGRYCSGCNHGYHYHQLPDIDVNIDGETAEKIEAILRERGGE